MKQNKEIFEKYADKLLSAMRREALMNKEVAEIFGVPASYMSDMRKHPEKVAVPFMEKIRTWAISDKPLKDYKLPVAPDTDAAAINQQEADTIPTAELTTKSRKYLSKLAVKGLLKEHSKEVAEAVAESVNTEEPTKQEIATKVRKAYTRAHKPETTEEVTKVETKGGKVDLSEINFRSGVKLEIEIYEDGFILKTKMPVKS